MAVAKPSISGDTLDLKAGRESVMNVRGLGVATTLAMGLLGGPVHAQALLTDQIVQNGRLQTSDFQMADRAYYDCFAIDARAGDTWTVTMQSEDFDTYLAIGTGSNCGTMNVLQTNDDGTGLGLNSRISQTFDYADRYLVRATSLAGGETGRYTLIGVRAAGRVTEAPLPIRILLTGGETGYLGSGDRVEGGDGPYFDCYTFGGINGQTVTITHSSSDFDAYLKLYSGINCEGSELASNDDGGGGLNSRLDYTFAGEGVYSVRATSLGRDVGDYNLTVELR